MIIKNLVSFRSPGSYFLKDGKLVPGGVFYEQTENQFRFGVVVPEFVPPAQGVIELVDTQGKISKNLKYYQDLTPKIVNKDYSMCDASLSLYHTKPTRIVWFESGKKTPFALQMRK